MQIAGYAMQSVVTPLSKFKQILLDELAKDDRRYAVFNRNDRRTWDPYGNDTRECVRQRVLAATSLRGLIAAHLEYCPDYWSESTLRAWAGLPE